MRQEKGLNQCRIKEEHLRCEEGTMKFYKDRLQNKIEYGKSQKKIKLNENKTSSSLFIYVH